MLSKLDYCDTVYYPLPEFQLKRLQRVQLVAASFVLNRYVNGINISYHKHLLEDTPFTTQ